MLARRRQAAAAARRGHDTAATAEAGSNNNSGGGASTLLVDSAGGRSNSAGGGGVAAAVVGGSGAVVDAVVHELLAAFAPYALPSLAAHDDDDKDEAVRLATGTMPTATSVAAAANAATLHSHQHHGSSSSSSSHGTALVAAAHEYDDMSALYIERGGEACYDVPLTQAVLLVYLNPGSDPPDCVRVPPCARLECWLDVQTGQLAPQGALAARTTGMPLAQQQQQQHRQHTQQQQQQQQQPCMRHGRQSESDVVAEALERQYRAVLRSDMGVVRVADAAIDVARSALVKARRMAAHDGRVLVHYNGHGMPRATHLGEVWLLDADKTHYVPLNLIEAAELVGAPVLFVLDCNAAAAVLQRWLRDRVHERRPHDVFICACGAGETLPLHPALPADVLTACMTTPLAMALEWFLAYSPRAVLLPQLTPAMVRGVPGDVADRRTPLGELTAVLHAVTDAIAWCTMRPAQFHYLFRQSAALKTLLRNAVLADRLLRECGCTPRTYPALSDACHVHPMWAAWDYAVEKALSALPRLAAATNNSGNNNKSNNNSGCSSSSNSSRLRELYEGTGFFDEQLTAFGVWLHSGDTTQLPVQLPCVLLALTQTAHRVRAFTLLVRYLDTGRVAGKRAVLCGLVPYVSRLMAKAPEVFLLSAVLWMQLVRADAAAGCREMQTTQCEKYFVRLLRLDATAVHVRTVDYGERVHVTTTTATAATATAAAAAATRHPLPRGGSSSSNNSLSPGSSSPSSSPMATQLPSHPHHTQPAQQQPTSSSSSPPRQPLQPSLPLHRPTVLASHAVLQQGGVVYYLLPDIDVARCKCMACYVLCQFMQRGERACVVCWNHHLLNATYPCLSAPQAELRSWACLTLATLSTHLRHAHEYLSRACTTRLDGLTRLLHDHSPVVRSSCVTLLASIVGARLDRLSPPSPAEEEAAAATVTSASAFATSTAHDEHEQQQQQLRRVQMEKTMLIRLRTHVYDASMDVREELVYFACRVLYAYGSILTARDVAVDDDDDDADDDGGNDGGAHRDDKSNDDNNANAMAAAAHADHRHSSSGTPYALQDILAGVARTRVVDYVAHTWQCTPPTAPLWALDESDVTVRSQLHASRPTVSARFSDAVVFDTTFLTNDDDVGTTSSGSGGGSAATAGAVDGRRVCAAARAVLRGLLHDAARMLQVLYHNCDAAHVRNALRELARATASPAYVALTAAAGGGRGGGGMAMARGNSNSSSSSAALPPRSRRLATEALRSMSRVASSELTTAATAATAALSSGGAAAALSLSRDDVTTATTPTSATAMPLATTTTNALLHRGAAATTTVFASEADRARATWNTDMMRQLVLDLRDRRLVPRAAAQLGGGGGGGAASAVSAADGVDGIYSHPHHGSRSLSRYNSSSSNSSSEVVDNNNSNNDDDSNSTRNAAMLFTRHPVLPSVLPCSSVVCTAFRALEPAAVVVTRDQRFHYVSYGDCHRQQLLHSFALPLRDAVQDVRLVNDLAEQPGLLVIDMCGRFHLIKHCWRPDALPTVAAVFAACPVAPWMTSSSSSSSSTRVDLKCAYRPDTATLYYGGLLHSSAAGAMTSSGSNVTSPLVNEIHALSLAEEQVVQRLPVSGNAKLTCLAAHTTQRALLAGFADGVVRYYDDRQRQGQLGTVGLMQCSSSNSNAAAAAGGVRSGGGVDAVVGVGPIASLTSGGHGSTAAAAAAAATTMASSSSSTAAGGAAAGFAMAAATRSALYVFDIRKLSEPLLCVSAADLYAGGVSAARTAPANASAATPGNASSSAPRTPPRHITNCVVGVHTGLIALSFADGSYGAYNDRGVILHDRPLRASDSAAQSSSSPSLLPLPCSCAAHPLRPMMSFGGDMLTLQL